MTFRLNDAYLLDSYVIGGKLEGEGPVGSYLDFIKDYKSNSFENSEILMLRQCIDMLFEKLGLSSKDIDLCIGGELSNQLATSSYTMRMLDIPFMGIYSACSSIALGLGLGALLLSRIEINRILVFTSSFNQSAERQFRNPNEYGGGHEGTQTSTSTIAASAIVTKERSRIGITEFTVGRVIDVEFTDSMDFGRAMAPAALESLLDHFKDTKAEPSDYDLILTGDLSSFGYNIVLKELKKNYGMVTNYQDCGLLLYDIKKQDVLAGGSGPGTSAAVLLAYIKKEMLKGKYKKVLLCATGVLMNPCMVLQKNSLPSIAHCITLEVIK